MKKIFLILITFIIFISFITLVKKPRSTLTIGAQRLSVEVVDTGEKITKGLGDRDNIGSDGMFFVMPARSIPTFWMKNMRFDLDFVWIDGDQVMDLTENVSAQRGAADSNLKLYSPKAEVTHVLEMTAGEVKKRGILIGDKVAY